MLNMFSMSCSQLHYTICQTLTKKKKKMPESFVVFLFGLADWDRNILKFWFNCRSLHFFIFTTFMTFSGTCQWHSSSVKNSNNIIMNVKRRGRNLTVLTVFVPQLTGIESWSTTENANIFFFQAFVVDFFVLFWLLSSHYTGFLSPQKCAFWPNDFPLCLPKKSRRPLKSPNKGFPEPSLRKS